LLVFAAAGVWPCFHTLMRLSGSRLISPPIIDCPTSTLGAGGGDAGRGASLT
jgi:hypothetical protein